MGCSDCFENTISLHDLSQTEFITYNCMGVFYNQQFTKNGQNMVLFLTSKAFTVSFCEVRDFSWSWKETFSQKTHPPVWFLLQWCGTRAFRRDHQESSRGVSPKFVRCKVYCSLVVFLIKYMFSSFFFHFIKTNWWIFPIAGLFLPTKLLGFYESIPFLFLTNPGGWNFGSSSDTLEQPRFIFLHFGLGISPQVENCSSTRWPQKPCFVGASFFR